MFPPFPQELAHHYCTSLISRLNCGEAQLIQISRESSERKNQGVMLGALVCSDKNNNTVVLYAVSGNGKILQVGGDGALKEIVVPSIVSSDDINNALAQYDKEIHILTDKINNLKCNSENKSEKDDLILKRSELTTISLKRVFNLYNFTRFDKKSISLNSIIEKHQGRLPPTGTGDCCAPKLLSYAFSHDLQPLSMDEVYYGKNTKTKINGQSYEPCDDRCGYILPYILGVEILYRDSDIIIVNKESGLLAIPGKGDDKQDSVESRIRLLFPNCIKQPAVHRLDMETSGIMVLAFNKSAHSKLNEDFALNLVQKKYVALLDGILRGNPQGHVELKTIVDLNNRPHQIIDNKNGKLGITNWKKIGVKKITLPMANIQKQVTIVEFTPITGRTHQLRLCACSSISDGGLGLPIVGDTLYGTNINGERLMLHAFYIKFNHPITNRIVEITTKIPF